MSAAPIFAAKDKVALFEAIVRRERYPATAADHALAQWGDVIARPLAVLGAHPQFSVAEAWCQRVRLRGRGHSCARRR